MNDSDILELYQSRSEQAIEKTREKYGKLCASVIRGILPNKEDVEEVLSDCLMRAWNAIPPEQPDSLSAYLCRIARNEAINRYKFNAAKKRDATLKTPLNELIDCLPATTPLPDEEAMAQELGRSLNSFLSSLDSLPRNIFMRRYYFSDSIADIALLFSKTQSQVKSSLFRTRRALKLHLIKGGFLNEE